MSIVRWFVIGCVLGQLSACKRSGEASAPEQAPAATAAAAEKPSRAAEEVKPAELDPADAMVAEGAALYARMCAVCHGESGEGYKADQAPALRQQDFLAAVSDDFLGMSIADGRKGTSMSAWFIERGGPLSERDIAALILFLRSWQTKPPISLDQRPVHGDEQRGKTLFEQHCASCHGPQGKYVRILGRQFLSLASNGYLRQVLRDGRPSAPRIGRMIGGTLPPDIQPSRPNAAYRTFYLDSYPTTVTDTRTGLKIPRAADTPAQVSAASTSARSSPRSLREARCYQSRDTAELQPRATTHHMAASGCLDATRSIAA
jgi:mono/diheme cytochrome c family protein